MSVDAIDPLKGHVRGNLRVICLYLNNTNRDNDKKHHDENDAQSAWTTDKHDEYMGIEIKLEDSKQHAVNEEIKNALRLECTI